MEKLSTNQCPLYTRKQTLLHVLNNCPVSFGQDRYTWRHDVLLIFKDYLREHPVDGYSFDCNLPDCSDDYLLREFVSVLRRDICIFHNKEKELLLLELTIPFGAYESMADAEDRKHEKYQSL